MIKHVTINCSDMISCTPSVLKDANGRVEGEIIDDGGVLFLNSKNGWNDLKLIFESKKHVDFLINTLISFRDEWL